MAKLLRSMVFIYILLGISGCQAVWREPIPDSEIIFQGKYYRTSPHWSLGFIDPTGKNNQIVRLPRKFSMPVWSTNGNILYGFSESGGQYGGYPAYWDIQKGKFKVCYGQLPFFNQIQGFGDPENSYEVIVQNGSSIILMDLSICKQLRTLLDYSHENMKITGFTYFSTEQELIYGLVMQPQTNRSYQLMMLDINSGVSIQLAEGINPAWSPDGLKVAYIGMDGLYLIDFSRNAKESQKILNAQFFDPWKAGSPYSFVTIPSWSPDGEWLIYHRCNTIELCTIEESGIYKININGGDEIPITQGGEYPSWRP